MFKIFSHTILAVVLLVSTIGLVVSKHYCGGVMIAISVFHEEEPCCDMGGCCKNETHTFQVKEDFSTPAFTTLPTLAEIEILGHDLFETEGLIESENDPESFVVNSPPPKTIQTVLSLKQVYLL